MIWAGFGLMTLTAVVFAAWPLFAKGKSVVATEDGTSAVLVDQLDEVQRDLERRVISEEEANAARMEIKRRILALSRKTSDAGPRSSGDGNAAMYLAALFVPILAIGYYSMNGAPVSSSRALEELQAEREEEQKVADLAQKLFERLIGEPNGGQSDGWMLLGQTYMRMGEHHDAVQAFEVITRREGATSETWSRLAEALVMAEAGIVTPRAQSAIDQAFSLDPANPAAAFYMAVSLEQAGKATDAHELLVSRLNEAEGFAPWMETFVAKANRIGGEIGRVPVNLASFAPMVAGPGPSADDVAADDMILDIGPSSANALAAYIKEAKTIIWNGPVGVFEFSQFSEGTRIISKAIAESEGFSIAGGGDTLAAVDQFDIADKVSYISTGGGAFLEYVEGKALPAVEILKK